MSLRRATFAGIAGASHFVELHVCHQELESARQGKIPRPLEALVVIGEPVERNRVEQQLLAFGDHFAHGTRAPCCSASTALLSSVLT